MKNIPVTSREDAGGECTASKTCGCGGMSPVCECRSVGDKPEPPPLNVEPPATESKFDGVSFIRAWAIG